jgi:hypothetical protein
MDKSKIAHLNPQEYTHLPHADQHFEEHEQTDVAIRPLIATIIGIAVLVAVSAIGLWGMFELMKYVASKSSDNQQISKIEPAVRTVPAGYPPLQGVPAPQQDPNTPAQDMAKMRKQNLHDLAGIEKVMDQALAQGVFKTAAKSPSTQPSAAAQ